MQHTRRGFTLIELLVVVGIIVLLVGIILPVVNWTRESARRTLCMKNQVEVYKAMIHFYNDNTEQFPGSAGRVIGTSPGTGQYIGAGQLITLNNDVLQQSILDKTSHSALIPKYVNTSAIFRCPQQDLQGGLEQKISGSQACFQYVFNEYFVGDLVANTPTNPTNFLPVFSPNYPICMANGRGNTMNHCNKSNCVLITEDISIVDTTTETKVVTATGTATYLRASPIHAPRGHKTADKFAYTNADYAVCTYVDGHSALVQVDTTGGTTGYTVPSDNSGLQR